LRSVLVLAAIFIIVRTLSPGFAQVPAGNTTPQTPAGNAAPQAPTTGIVRKGPPQPQLKQTLDYFVGTWTVTWSGRESAFSPGPRTGTVRFTKLADSNFLEMRGEGKAEGGGAYKESGTLGWHEGQKILALQERLATGVELLSIGDWTSPISIRFDSAPLTVKGEILRLRRTYGIVSSGSFTVTEEQSTDGTTFSRIGRGVFGKVVPK
jgi:hypothetical protein